MAAPVGEFLQLGVVGVLAYMWWYERADRVKGEKQGTRDLAKADSDEMKHTARAAADKKQLADLVLDNMQSREMLLTVIQAITRTLTLLADRLEHRPCMLPPGPQNPSTYTPQSQENKKE